METEAELYDPPRYYNPPWVMFHDQEKPGVVDILPAGRPGVVLESVPEDLAAALCSAASQWRTEKTQKVMKGLTKELKDLTRSIERHQKSSQGLKGIRARQEKRERRRRKKRG